MPGPNGWETTVVTRSTACLRQSGVITASSSDRLSQRNHGDAPYPFVVVPDSQLKETK
jgi:hypothetical protein